MITFIERNARDQKRKKAVAKSQRRVRRILRAQLADQVKGLMHFVNYCHTANLDMYEVLNFWIKRHKQGPPLPVEMKQRKERAAPKLQPFEKKMYHRALSMNSRALKLNALGTVTPEDLIRIMNEAGHKCRKCPSTERLAFDHIKPYYCGGDNWPTNLQVLCGRCNMEKGIRDESASPANAE